MSWDEKVACAVNAVIGGVLGVAIFFGGLGWMDFLGRNALVWWTVFLMCTLLGASVGVVSYFRRHEGVELHFVGIYSGASGGWLLARRIGVLLGSVVAVYFMWQLARGI